MKNIDTVYFAKNNEVPSLNIAINAHSEEWTTVASNPQRRQAIVEAILFAAARFITSEEISQICGWSVTVIENDMMELARSLEGRGISLQKSAGAYRLVTSLECSPWVEKYLQIDNRVKLSRPQMEVLAVVAYNQPVTRAIIDSYRGVRSERVVNQLEDLHLIRETGRADMPGHPILYSTTDDFLKYLALDSLDELPELFPPISESEGEEAFKGLNIGENYQVAEQELPKTQFDNHSDSLQRLLAKVRRKSERENKDKGA